MFAFYPHRLDRRTAQRGIIANLETVDQLGFGDANVPFFSSVFDVASTVSLDVADAAPASAAAFGCSGNAIVVVVAFSVAMTLGAAGADCGFNCCVFSLGVPDVVVVVVVVVVDVDVDDVDVVNVVDTGVGVDVVVVLLVVVVVDIRALNMSFSISNH